MRSINQALALLTPSERKHGAITLLLVMGVAFLETAGLASVMPFLAVLSNPELLTENKLLALLYSYSKSFGVESPKQFLIFTGVGSFALIIFSAIHRAYTHYRMNLFLEMCRHSMSARLLELYLRQPYSFFLHRLSGDISKTILSEVDQVMGYVFRPASNIAVYGLVLIFITTLLIAVDPLIALLVAGTFVGLYTAVYSKLRKKVSFLGSLRASSNKGRFLAVTEVFGGIKSVKLLCCERHYIERFSNTSITHASTQAAHLTINQLPNFFIEAIALGAMLLLTIILLAGADDLNSEALGKALPILGLYALASYRLKPALQNIYQGLTSVRYGKAAIEAVYSDLYPQVPPSTLPISEPSPLRPGKAIAFSNLSFVYPEATHPSLININLEIPVGSYIGVVGSTGAGKTTFVDVLLGLLTPSQGKVLVDGMPVSGEQIRAWRRAVGYVPQEIFLVDATIAENIALGVPKDRIDLDKVKQCSRMARAHDYISNDLPDGYQTIIGERGVRLSGGQRQRLGIARALYHDPSVLVFDEATSALDAVTEKSVLESINALSNRKTIIHIAHRLSTIESCDKIVLIDRGKILAAGKYDELLLDNKIFQKLAGL